METIYYLEILDRLNQVKERYKIQQWPLQIGRAYSNDIIIDDDYISPHHLVIQYTSQQQLVVNDLDSTNGLFVADKKTDTVLLANETCLRIGHTLLRFRAKDYPVAHSQPDPLSSGKITRLFYQAKIGLLLMIITLAYALFYEHHIDYGDTSRTELLVSSLPWLVFVVFWAAIWSLLSRIICHHFYFIAHLTLACLLVLVIGLESSLIEYASFIFSWDNSWLDSLLLLLILAVVFYQHGYICLLSHSKKMATITLIVISIIASTSYLYGYVESQQFSNKIQFETVLKPASFPIFISQDIAGFMQDIKELEQPLIDESKKPVDH